MSRNLRRISAIDIAQKEHPADTPPLRKESPAIIIRPILSAAITAVSYNACVKAIPKP